jgi:hypothetical protein
MSQKIVTVNGSQNLVLINTAIDTNTIVRLDTPIQSGLTVTIRDNAGGASASNSIIVSTISGVSLYSGIQQTSNILNIQQPFGFITLYSSSSQNRWNVMNTFGFQPEKTVYNIESLAVSTIYMQDIAGGPTSQINVSNGILQVNGSNIEGGGGGGTVPDPLTVQSIHVSSIKLSSNVSFSPYDNRVRLEVSGTVQTNFLSIVDQGIPSQINIISSENNTLCRNKVYPISPVGAYIEFGYLAFISVAVITYPLYLGGLNSMIEGWWSTNGSLNPIFASGSGFINGFIVLPGHAITVYSSINLTGNITCILSNTTSMPLYSNINNGSGYIGAIAGSYQLISIS